MDKNKTIITFYSGMKTIGGTIISVTYNRSRVIFDFGMTNPNIFDSALVPRQKSMVEDYIKLNILPRVDGVFSKNDLGALEVKAAGEEEVETGVVISHMHLDHMALIGLLDQSIPVYVSKDSKRLYEALCEVGEKQPGNDTKIIGVDYEGEFNIGEIKVIPIQVDHDVLGACGFKIITPDGEISYTGDIRFHGMNPEITHQMIDSFIDTDVLITEGVTISFIEDDYEIIANPDNPEDMLTEANLMDTIKEKIEETKGIVFFNCYNRNIQRIKNLLDMCKEANREVILELKNGELCKKLLNRNDFLVMSESANDGGITIEEINENPSKYIRQITYENSLDLLDLNVEEGIYIHSNGSPIGPYDPAYDRLLNILSTVDLEFTYIGCGGHALPEQLKYTVDMINPKVLVPYHSFKPEKLMGNQGVQVLPKPYEAYRLQEGRLVKLQQ